MNRQSANKVPVKNMPSDPRIDRLKHLFKVEFASYPEFFVRVPGRVNIIGEHIDYCGYPVLPMALEQDILIAAGTFKESELHVRNVDNKYNDLNYKITTFDQMHIESDSNGRPYWYNYVLCGFKGVLEYLKNEFNHGLRIYVDGNIPPASGLSSSSALVSASSLAFLYSQGVILNKSEIASLCASSERYIGTQGGGMDQAIAFLAETNCAQYITWKPLRATAIALPEDVVFVVAHSLAESNKAASNDFNRRVIECRLAAKILVQATGVKNDSKIITLSEVQTLLGKNLEEMINFVLKYLQKNVYSKDEVADILGTTVEELERLYLTDNTKDLTEFKLKQRALHVYEEALRVEHFRDICSKLTDSKKGKPNGNNEAIYCENEGDKEECIEKLGNLLSKSHHSLKNLYECSHENLDRLVEVSKEMQIHSRLTGAGWGGCIVALCPLTKVDDYLTKLSKEYYQKFCNLDEESSRKYAFATKPYHGAVIYSTNN